MDIYSPLTEGEYKELFPIADAIIQSNGFPYGSSNGEINQRRIIWHYYKRINPQGGNEPCACGSTQKYWQEAMNAIRSYILLVDKRQEELSTENTNITE